MTILRWALRLTLRRRSSCSFTVVIPTLDKLQKEGELGRRKITQWTRYLTVALAIIQSIGIAFALQNSEGNFVLIPVSCSSS